MALPVSTYHRLSQQEFWDADVVKYGHGALKMLPRGRYKSTARFTPPEGILRAKDYQRAFRSPYAWDWMRGAFGAVQKAGHPLIARYLMGATLKVAAPTTSRLRLHFFKTTWRSTDNKIRTLGVRIRAEHGAALNSANFVNGTTQIDNYLGQLPALRRDFLQRFSALRRTLLSLHDTMASEVRDIQFFVYEFMSQSPATRDILRTKYMALLRRRMTLVYTPALGEAVQLLNLLSASVNLAAAPTNTDDLISAFAEADEIRESLSTDLGHIRNLPSNPADITNASAFWTMTTSGRTSGDTKLKRLATHAINRLDPVGPVRMLIQRWLDILHRYGDVRDAVGSVRTATIDADLEAVMRGISIVGREAPGSRRTYDW